MRLVKVYQFAQLPIHLRGQVDLHSEAQTRGNHAEFNGR